MPFALPWILFAIATCAAVFGALAARSARATSGAERALRLEAEQTLTGLRAAKTKRERRESGQAGELQDLRKRLEKTKRRAFEAQAAVEPLTQRVTELEAELRGKESAIRQRDESLARAEALAAKAVGEREAARSEVERAGALATDRASADREADRAKLDALETRSANLEVRAADAEREAARYRQRYRTSQRLYTVIRSELEVAKDRVRELEGKPPRAVTAMPPPPIEEPSEEGVIP